MSIALIEAAWTDAILRSELSRVRRPRYHCIQRASSPVLERIQSPTVSVLSAWTVDKNISHALPCMYGLHTPSRAEGARSRLPQYDEVFNRALWHAPVFHIPHGEHAVDFTILGARSGQHVTLDAWREVGMINMRQRRIEVREPRNFLRTLRLGCSSSTRGSASA
jgi:hypothetical protein